MKESDSPTVAILSPSGENASIRQDQLSQGARDLLAWCFTKRPPYNGAEVLICEQDADNVCEAPEGTLHLHAGSDSMRYFSHADDERWAIIFANDVDGCPQRGEKLLFEKRAAYEAPETRL